MSKEVKRNDPVFGEMTYNHSWYKHEQINWWNQKINDIKITAHGYSGETISKHQQNAYLDYQKTIHNVIKKSLPALIKYLKDNHGKSYSADKVLEALTPINVVFLKDGNWGILFDSIDDSEHGVALYTKGKEFNVDSQDSFL